MTHFRREVYFFVSFLQKHYQDDNKKSKHSFCSEFSDLFKKNIFLGSHAATNRSKSSFKIKISCFDSVLLFPTWFTGDIRHRDHGFKGILYFFRALQFGCHSAIGSVHSVCYAPSDWLYWWFLGLFAFVGSTAYFFTNQIQIFFLWFYWSRFYTPPVKTNWSFPFV